jgi:hypothetical protein
VVRFSPDSVTLYEASAPSSLVIDVADLGRRKIKGDEPAPAAEAPTDNAIEQRANRVRALVEGNFGSILERKGDVMTVEVPADISLPWMGEYLAVYMGMRTGTAERRVSDINGNPVVCVGDWVTQNYFRYEIDLRVRPNDSAAQSAPAMSTRQVTP